jgi:hypothetical protein
MMIAASWGYHDFVLKSAAVAERGKLACLDTAATDGFVVPGAASATLLPIGMFMSSLTGDGIKTVQIKLFHEIWLFWWDNDTAAPLTVADVGHVAYIKDAQTVSKDSAGRSALGTVFAVDPAKGALVFSSYPFLAPAAPPVIP